MHCQQYKFTSSQGFYFLSPVVPRPLSRDRKQHFKENTKQTFKYTVRRYRGITLNTPSFSKHSPLALHDTEPQIFCLQIPPLVLCLAFSVVVTPESSSSSKLNSLYFCIHSYSMPSDDQLLISRSHLFFEFFLLLSFIVYAITGIPFPPFAPFTQPAPTPIANPHIIVSVTERLLIHFRFSQFCQK